jgi:hypothetical protein
LTTIEELKTYHEVICNHARKLVSERGKEYAVEEDTLITFRDAAAMYGCKPSDVARMMICIKIARLKFQHSMDTTYDLINYVIYHSELIQDEVSRR